ncbi:thiamine pyrophosphate-binding protein [Stella sp.]|uniref:thiamine pyrophosphate-binding protein n=1 Tax=Stella sp. TaxID=2912054 RepID=UPI0035B4E5CF
MTEAAAAPTWPDDIYRALKQAGIRQVAHVPDAGHARLIKCCEADNAMQVVTLTTEEEGVAMLCGAYLGGQRGVLLVQSSGVGNCINMLSLPQTCRMPFLMIVTMRGEYGEFNPWQNAMGRATEAVLTAMNVVCYRCDRPEDVGPTVANAARYTFEGGPPVAILLSQRLIGAKAFVNE